VQAVDFMHGQSFGEPQPLYATNDDKTQREANSTRTDQIGKVFMVVYQDMRRCLICEDVFTRQAAAQHTKVACSPLLPQVESGLLGIQSGILAIQES
jgi:hypothetical protein